MEEIKGMNSGIDADTLRKIQNDRIQTSNIGSITPPYRDNYDYNLDDETNDPKSSIPTAAASTTAAAASTTTAARTTAAAAKSSRYSKIDPSKRIMDRNQVSNLFFQGFDTPLFSKTTRKNINQQLQETLMKRKERRKQFYAHHAEPYNKSSYQADTNHQADTKHQADTQPANEIDSAVKKVLSKWMSKR